MLTLVEVPVANLKSAAATEPDVVGRNLKQFQVVVVADVAYHES